MAWIARDKTGTNPYRIFGTKPALQQMVAYDGELSEGHFTWTVPKSTAVPMSKRHAIRRPQETFGPLNNDEPTEIDPKDCPVELEPGEGPIEVSLSLKSPVPTRLFEGEGI